MSPQLIGTFGLIAVFGLIAMGMQIGYALTSVALAGLIVMVSFTGSMGILGIAPYSIVADYMFVTIPLFILMGNMAYASGVVTDGYTAGQKWLGRIPGGLAIATIMGCAGFAACTGSSTATSSLMTSTTLPEMERYKYSSSLATGTIASGSGLGILIPPSIPLVVYGLIARESIGRLFLAGIIPGIMLTLLYVATIAVWVKIRPSAGPPGPSSNWKDRLSSLKHILPMLSLGLTVIGGIWAGIFTPVEASGVGCFGALVIGLARRSLKIKPFIQALESTVKITAMIFVIVLGSMLFNRFITLTGLPPLLVSMVAESGLNTVALLVIIVAFYIVMGCLMDAFGLMMLTLPILIPVVSQMGVDLVMYGILMIFMIEMAQITPPIGINVFVISGVAKHIPMYTIFKGVVPFYTARLVMVALLIAYPAIATYLPSTMMAPPI